MFTQFHFEANVLLSFRYSVSKQMLAQMVRRYIGYYRLISHFSFSKTNRAIPRRRRGEQLQNPWQEALRFAEDAVLMYRENHAVFVLLCQPKQHMWFDAKTPIYLLDLAQLVDKAIEDKWHGRHFSKIWKILSKCQQSNSDAAISTHHVSASTVNTSWAAYSLLGSNSGLDKALYTHTHTHTHTENTKQSELGSFWSVGQHTGLNQDMWNPCGPAVTLSTACHRSCCMELSPRTQFTSLVEIRRAQQNQDLFVKSFVI